MCLFLLLGVLCSTVASAQYATATIVDCPNDGMGGVCVAYSGAGVKDTAVRYAPQSMQELRLTTTAAKAELNKKDTTKKAFPVGAVVQDLTVAPPDPPPTPVDPPSKPFCLAVDKVVRLSASVKLGILAANAKSLSDAIADAISKFDIAYLDCVPSVIP